MVEWKEQWPELFTFVFLILGFVIAVLLRNAFWSYLSVFMSGFVAGRVYYLKHATEPLLPFLLMMSGFLLGYFLGAVWINRIFVLVLFLLGGALSYYLHLKKIIVIFKNEPFIK